MATVRAALAELIENGLILEVKGGDGRTRYRLKQSNEGEMKARITKGK